MPLTNWAILFFSHFALIFLLKSEDHNRNQTINSLSRKLTTVYFALLFLFSLTAYYDFRFIVEELIKSSFYLILIIYCSKHFYLLRDIKLKPISLIITVLASLVFSLFIRELYGSSRSILSTDFSIINYGYFYAFLLLCVLPGITEEIFFRLVIFDKLKLHYSEKNTILISSFFFVLIHFVNYPLISAGYLFLLSIILGIIRVKFKNVNYCIVFHILYNFLILEF
jgi:membrane protease YdiL (CAAX protease family)